MKLELRNFVLSSSFLFSPLPLPLPPLPPSLAQRITAFLSLLPPSYPPSPALSTRQPHHTTPQLLSSTFAAASSAASAFPGLFPPLHITSYVRGVPNVMEREKEESPSSTSTSASTGASIAAAAVPVSTELLLSLQR